MPALNHDLVITIGPAQAADEAAILELLTLCRLPHDGLTHHLNSALVARTERGIIGSAALELYGTSALLRSVAVAPNFQGQGLGQRLTIVALEMAQSRGIRHVYLLTETASEFFPRFGFEPVERVQIPERVRSSVEFTTACPESALAMALTLQPIEPV